VRPTFAQASVAQHLVPAFLVVPADPSALPAPDVLEAGGTVLPDTFLLQPAKERSMIPFCSSVYGVKNSWVSG
jgi:hypothetical protein